MKSTIFSGCLLGGMLVIGGCQSEEKKSAEEVLLPKKTVQKESSPKKIRKKESKQNGIFRRSSMPPSGLTGKLTPAEQAALSAQRRENSNSWSSSFKKANEEAEKRNSDWVFGR